jgi:hypothetical protein
VGRQAALLGVPHAHIAWSHDASIHAQGRHGAATGESREVKCCGTASGVGGADLRRLVAAPVAVGAEISALGACRVHPAVHRRCREQEEEDVSTNSLCVCFACVTLCMRRGIRIQRSVCSIIGRSDNGYYSSQPTQRTRRAHAQLGTCERSVARKRVRTRALAVEPVVRTLSIAGLGRRVSDRQTLEAGLAPRTMRVARLCARQALGELLAWDCSARECACVSLVSVQMGSSEDEQPVGRRTLGAVVVLVGQAGAVVGLPARARHALGVVAPSAHRLLGTIGARGEVGTELVYVDDVHQPHIDTHARVSVRAQGNGVHKARVTVP